MKEICANCEHFEQVTCLPATHVFGNCTRSSDGLPAKPDKGKTFTWAQSTCDHHIPA